MNVSGGDGLYRFDLEKQSWHLITPPNSYNAPVFHGADLAFLNDELLILESIEVFTLSSDDERMISHPINNYLPKETKWKNFFVDSKGFIWLGGQKNGIIRVNSQNWEVNYFEDWSVPCEKFPFRYSFFEDSHQNIWMANCNGFSVYSHQKEIAYQFPFDKEAPSENSFETVDVFVEDQNGLIWVSSKGDDQMGNIDLNQIEKGLIKKFSLRRQIKDGYLKVIKGNGQNISDVSKLIIDAQNQLWGLCSEGVFKWNLENNTLEIFNDKDGLYWLDKELKVVTVNRLEKLSDGNLVVGFRKGLSVFNPTTLSASPEKPRPYLTSFKVYNNEWETDTSLLHTSNIHLDYWENYFSFDFSAIGFSNPEKFQYQYQLKGIDTDWIYSGNRKYASYTNIEGGDYEFWVRVANSDGVWGAMPLKINLHLATPWWEQWWFKGGVLLLLCGGIYTFYTYRLKQVKVKADLEKKLANVELQALRSQMNPHFIFNCLSSIENYIIKNETLKAAEYLGDFSLLIRLILRNSRAEFISLSDEIESLKLYLEMESLRFNHRLSYELKVESELDPDRIKIPPMLIQPYVENAIWHGLRPKAGQGSVKLSMARENGNLQCIIEDNGVGRHKAAELKAPNTKKKSLAMSITQERLNTLNKIHNTNSRVKIIDLIDEEGKAQGTKVDLIIGLADHTSTSHQ